MRRRIPKVTDAVDIEKLGAGNASFAVLFRSAPLQVWHVPRRVQDDHIVQSLVEPLWVERALSLFMMVEDDVANAFLFPFTRVDARAFLRSMHRDSACRRFADVVQRFAVTRMRRRVVSKRFSRWSQ